MYPGACLFLSDEEQMITHAQVFRFLADIKMISYILFETCVVHSVDHILE